MHAKLLFVNRLEFFEDLFGLQGRSALITGGSSGIGRAIAIALAGAGAHVLVAARTETAIDDTVLAVHRFGGSAAGIVADLSTRAGAHILADEAGAVDIVVNSAGVLNMVLVDDCKPVDLREALRIELRHQGFQRGSQHRFAMC